MSEDLIKRSDAIGACAYETIECYEARKAIRALPSADRPSGYIHIDDVYRLVAGHSNYHGDSILSAFTCLTEGKDVKPIRPLDRPQGKWLKFGLGRGTRILFCTNCERRIEVPLSQGDSNYDFCPNCGARMKGGSE